MNDLISRRAAIDALMEILDRPNHAEFLYTDEICRALNYLPSAQPEPCEDAVSRADVVDMLEMYPFTEYSEYEAAMEAVKRLPSAQPMRKRGKWVSPFGIGCVCNCCGYDINEHGIDIRVDGEPNFCPNCGADMRGDKDEN